MVRLDERSSIGIFSYAPLSALQPAVRTVLSSIPPYTLAGKLLTAIFPCTLHTTLLSPILLPPFVGTTLMESWLRKTPTRLAEEWMPR